LMAWWTGCVCTGGSFGAPRPGSPCGVRGGVARCLGKGSRCGPRDSPLWLVDTSMSVPDSRLADCHLQGCWGVVVDVCSNLVGVWRWVGRAHLRMKPGRWWRGLCRGAVPWCIVPAYDFLWWDVVHVGARLGRDGGPCWGLLLRPGGGSDRSGGWQCPVDVFAGLMRGARVARDILFWGCSTMYVWCGLVRFARGVPARVVGSAGEGPVARPGGIGSWSRRAVCCYRTAGGGLPLDAVVCGEGGSSWVGWCCFCAPRHIGVWWGVMGAGVRCCSWM